MKKNRLFTLAFLLIGILFAQNSHAQTTLERHTDDVTSVAFSPNGTILASGSEDGMVMLWDISPYITIQSQTLSPDFDGDSIVGISDLLLFVDHFGLTQGDARYDLDGDGSIGISDFLIFVDAFGKEGTG